jgi:hypothetical protein
MASAPQTLLCNINQSQAQSIVVPLPPLGGEWSLDILSPEGA